MATIRRRGDLQWQALIRKRGYPQQSKTFDTKAEAEAWVAVVESEMVRGLFVSRAEAEQTTLGDILQRYEREVAPTHKGVVTESYRLRQLRQHPIAASFLASLQPLHFAKYRDDRLKQVAPATVERELTQFQQVIEHARREWQIALPANPVKWVKRPRYHNQRNRRLSSLEEIALMNAITAVGRRPDGRFGSGVQTQWLKPVVIFAIETAMRLSEITGLMWKHVDLDLGTAHLTDSKNGRPRTVPLSMRARALLRGLPKSIDDRVFPVSSNALKLSWQRAVRRTGIEDLHFHDLRHEATSRLAQRVPNIIELAAITGHSDVNMLKRYYHISAADLAKKIE